MIAQNSEVYNPPTYLFSLYTYMEKDLCRGVVYFTVLCDHPCLVSLLFAVLVSLHPVTFSNVFYYLYNYGYVLVLMLQQENSYYNFCSKAYLDSAHIDTYIDI